MSTAASPEILAPSRPDSAPKEHVFILGGGFGALLH